MKLIENLLIRNRELNAAFSALALGVGAGFVVVGAAYAAMDRDTEGLRMWETGTSALIAGCALTACAAKGESLYRRAWVRRYR